MSKSQAEDVYDKPTRAFVAGLGAAAVSGAGAPVAAGAAGAAGVPVASTEGLGAGSAVRGGKFPPQGADVVPNPHVTVVGSAASTPPPQTADAEVFA